AKRLSLDSHFGRPTKHVQLDEHEKILIFDVPETWRIIMEKATTKRTRKLISNAIAFISIKKEGFSQEMFQIIERELNEKDDTDLKVYLQTLEKMMLINDELQAWRVTLNKFYFKIIG